MRAIDLPLDGKIEQVPIQPGESLVILGANGSGKTRLGVRIEENLGESSHRIGAHRSLVMETGVEPPSFDRAEQRLLYGRENGSAGARAGNRWGNRPATLLISDFNFLLAALYADENQVSVAHRQAHKKDLATKPPETKLDRLAEIWNRLLPHRTLQIGGGSVKVAPSKGEGYDGSQMSDGERVMFYLMGHVLLAKPGTIIIVDEPELHINRAILPALWDAIEASRRDCAFVYLTHDLEFATSRRGARKFYLRSYETSGGERWSGAPFPEGEGLPEDVLATIVGSRAPILFVEGERGSLDPAVYRRVFSEFTVLPVGGCDDVVHSVRSFRANRTLHHLTCSGLVDHDGRDDADADRLRDLGIAITPVSEIENVFLLEAPFDALAKLLKFDEPARKRKFAELQAYVLDEAAKDVEKVAVRHTRRRLDKALKSLGLTAKSIDGLEKEYATAIATVSPVHVFASSQSQFSDAIRDKDYATVLRLYDRKGLLSEAAKLLDLSTRDALEEFVCRAIMVEDGKELLSALKAALPNITIP